VLELRGFDAALKTSPMTSPEVTRTRQEFALKMIGLIGGMSWESTVPYYCQINEFIKERLGGLHSAKLILYSVDFHEIEQLQRLGDWAGAGALLAHAARALQGAGADLLVLCTNTMHKVASVIESAVEIPLLHIADPTADEIKRAGFTRVGLLGTRFTMEGAFYSDRLRERHGLQVLIPEPPDRDLLPASRTEYRRIMSELSLQGAQAIILGCTEIALLVNSEDAMVPLFDTTRIHARAAAQWALSAHS
jgi:aspartate racemase